MIDRYNPFETEPHWQAAWLAAGLSAAPGEDPPGPPLHVGGLRRLVMADVVARFEQARGGVLSIGPLSSTLHRLGLLGTVGAADFAAAGVGHETYRHGDGAPLSPDDVRVLGTHGERRAVRLSDGAPVAIGPVRPMAWSAGNAVAANDMIATYGADALRLSLVADTPPERPLVWTEDAVHAACRFAQKLHRLVPELAFLRDTDLDPDADDGEAVIIRDATHRALASIQAGIERRRFHLCVAHLHGLVNRLALAVGDIETERLAPALAQAFGEAACALVQAAAPFVPHVAESEWVALGHHTLLASTPWRTADPSRFAPTVIVWPVWIDGRQRAELALPRNVEAAAVEAAALADPAVRKALAGRAPRKVIVVPKGLVHVVV